MSTSSKTIERKYLAISLVASAFLLSFQLLFPLSFDNEIFQSMASELYRFHRLPYLGTWDQNFPGTIYLHWLSIVLFGDSAIGFRVFDLIFHLGMSWLLFMLLRRWLSARSTALAVIVYNAHYISNFWLAGLKDPFAVGFLLLGTCLLFVLRDGTSRPSKSHLLAFGAGMSIAMMTAIRPTYLLFLFPALGFLWTIPQRRPILLLSFLGGALILMVALVMPYALTPGGLEQAYLSTFRYNLDLYGQARIPSMFLHALRLMKFFLIPGLAGIALALVPRLRVLASIRRVWDGITRPIAAERVLIVGYAVAGLISLLVMGKYYPYHFEPVMLVLLPFASLAFESLIAGLRRPAVQVAALLVILGFYAVRVFPLYLVQPVIADALNGIPHPLEAAQDMLQTDSGYPRSTDAAVARYVDETSPPGERFESATLNGALRWRTARMSASRFTTFYPLTASSPNGEHPAFQQRWRQEYIDSLLSARPYYIVISDEPMEIFGWIHKTPMETIHEIPGFDRLVLPRYQFDTAMGGYTILRRRH